MTDVSRRDFLCQSSSAVAGLTLASGVLATKNVIGANEKINLGVIGTGGMGSHDMKLFLRTKRVNVVGVCDVDEERCEQASEIVEEITDEVPKTYSDFRKLLENKDIDAVLVATPDHWHAICAIMACEAGKDVYVEKPCAHNVHECRQIAAAAKKYKRVVQHGTQQRSGDQFIEAREYVQSGKLGKIGIVRAWALPEAKTRYVEVVPDSDPPEVLDYDFWLGPAPQRPYNKNRGHYNWRFVWDYGTGDMGNWGVHWIDCGIWSMGLEWPKAVSSSGGNFVQKDAKETPDTQISLFEYDGLTLIWEQRMWSNQLIEGHRYGTAFYGDQGTLVVNRDGFWVYGGDENELVAQATKVSSIDELSLNHMNNFIDCIASREAPAADIASGGISAAVSLLGNVAFLGESRVVYDPAKDSAGNEKVDALLTRKYRDKWPLPKI